MTIPFTLYESNATIGTTERSIIGDTTTAVPLSSTVDGLARVMLDLSALAAGDEYALTVYSAVNGGTQRTLEVIPLVGVYGSLYLSQAFPLNDGWDITLKKTAGTDRAIRWSVKLQNGDANVVSMAADTITASALAGDAVSEIGAYIDTLIPHGTPFSSLGGFYPVRNDADAYIYFWLGLSTDATSPAIGINTAKLTFFWMAQGSSAFTDISTDNASATATDCGLGWYRYALDSTRVDDGDGIGVFHVVWTAGVVIEGEVRPQSRCEVKVLVGSVDSAGKFRASVRAMEADTLTASAVATGAIDTTALAAGAIHTTAIAADAITAAMIAPGAIDYATFASDALDLFRVRRRNTAAAGSATTITLDAAASATNSFYNGSGIFIYGGTGAGQHRMIQAYVGATKVATVGTWQTNPDATSTFVIFGDSKMLEDSAVTAAAIASSAITSAKFAASAITSTVLAADCIGASQIATDAIGSAELAASAVTEIQSGLATSAALTTVAGYIDTEVASILADTTDIKTRIPAALVSGRIDASVGAVAANAITAAAIADGAIDLATFASDAMLSALGVLASGTAQAGSGTTITLAAGASADDHAYVGCIILIVSGVGALQSARVDSYVGATKVATILRGWTTNPNVTSVYSIFKSNPIVDVYRWNGYNQAGSYPGVDVISMSANTITASALAVDAVTEIQSGLATAAAVTAGSIASAVWDAVAASFVAVGSTGEALQAGGGGGATAAEVVDYLMAYSHDTGVSILGLMRRLESVMSGKATGLIGSVARYFMRDGTTAAIEASQSTVAGTRSVATVTGSEP